MASNSILVEGASADAARLLARAITAAGGTIGTQTRGESMSFSIGWTAEDGISLLSSKYNGVARLTPVRPAQTRIDFEMTQSPATIGLYVLLAIFGIFVFGFTPVLGPLELIMLVLLVAYLGSLAWTAYQSATVWPRQLLDRIMAGLAPVTSEPNATAPFTPAPVGPDFADQLLRFGELRATGLITDLEFDTKKTEVLMRA